MACREMKPVLEELAKEFQGRASVLDLSVDEYPELANKVKVRFIPLQIFYDKDGKEAWRHEGFLEKEKIVAKLKELGVE